jgi:hypothetical protein
MLKNRENLEEKNDESSVNMSGGNAGIIGAGGKVYGGIHHHHHYNSPVSDSADSNNMAQEVAAISHIQKYLIDRTHHHSVFKKEYTETCERDPFGSQVYILQGYPEDHHVGFIKRMKYLIIDNFHHKAFVQSHARYFYSDWPCKGVLQERWNVLFDALASSIGNSMLDMSSPERISEAIPESKIIFAHTIHANDWDKCTYDLICQYIQFFNGYKTVRPRKQYIIFLNVRYESNWLKKRMSFLWRRKIYTNLELLLKELPEGACRINLLDKFETLQEKDIDSWYENLKSKFGEDSVDESVQQQVDKMKKFAQKKQLTMEKAFEHAKLITKAMGQNVSKSKLH